MECSHARLLLLFDGPDRGEFPAEDAEAWRIHLEQCPDCGMLARRERLTDAVLGPALRNVTVPDGLQERILQRLQRERRVNPWPWVAGIAAALLLAVGLGGIWLLRPTSTHFDHAAFDASFQSSPSEYFAKQRVPFAMAPSSDWDPQYLDSWDMVELQGRRVARLRFVKAGEPGHGEAVAYVYVLPKGTFHFDAEFAGAAALKSSSVELKSEDDFDFLSKFIRGSRSAFKRNDAAF